ncbi:hypothetical protein L6452_30808 [Arctium lappa]|uniref:Uncharacterized protein n=1 Tax=Arctium lappa TaxID=4217 RepID=A0ACB8ZJN9_ARCLA|nr:hypothetical protein L6452_30808 [Arctium lappa]
MATKIDFDFGLHSWARFWFVIDFLFASYLMDIVLLLVFNSFLYLIARGRRRIVGYGFFRTELKGIARGRRRIVGYGFFSNIVERNCNPF